MRRSVSDLLDECAIRQPLCRGLGIKFKRLEHYDKQLNGHVFRFYKRAALAAAELQGRHRDDPAIVVDMERVEKDCTGKFVSFGRVYTVCTRNELQHLICALHFSDLHLYESLGHTPHKLLVDMDRDLPADTPCNAIHTWNEILHEEFLPFFCDFINKTLTNLPKDVVVGDFLILDASKAGKKYSKHVLLHTDPAICSPTREHEKALMMQFKSAVDTACCSNLRLRSLVYMVTKDGEDGDVIDYNIYTPGTRSMRLVGSCKGDNKAKANRNLIPVGTLRQLQLPWWAYTCNVWGQPCVLWQTNLRLAAAKGHKRRRSTSRVPAERVQRGEAGVPQAASEMLFRIANVVHPYSRSVHTQMMDDDFVCMINYAAPSGEERCCAFAQEPHTRHYSALILSPGGDLEYFCYGCRDSVCLARQHAPKSGGTHGATSTFKGQAKGALSNCVYRQISQPYLPPLHFSTAPETYAIKSAMGTGKTHCMAVLLSGAPSNASVLSIGFRQTLNTSLAKRFALDDYVDVDTDLLSSCDRLSIQLDSLIKLLQPKGVGDKMQLRQAWDIVIVDEAESLLAHLLSETMQNSVQHVWKIFWCIAKNASKLLLCDADLGANGMHFLALLSRPTVHHVWHNSYIPRKLTYVIMCNSETFTARIVRLIKKGSNVFVASNSLRYALYLKTKLCAVSTSVLLIQGASSAGSKKAVADCEIVWSQQDAVICTPAVAAGVDFSSKGHFDAIFVYGTNKSNSARELNQQSGRVRHPKSSTITVCIEESPPRHPLPADTRSVRTWFDKSGQTRFKHLMEMHVDENGKTGQVALRASACPPGLKEVLCAAILEKNKSKNNMREEYLDIVAMQGGDVVQLPSKPASYRSVLSRRNCAVRAEIQSATTIAAAPYIPKAHFSASGKLLTEEVQRKAEVCDFYGGHDIKDTMVFLHLSSRRIMQATQRWCEAMTPHEHLQRRESTSGCLQQAGFGAGNRDHVCQHGSVLEITAPSWERRQKLFRLLCISGFAGASCCIPPLTCAVPDLVACLQGGCCTRLATQRCLQHTQLHAYACEELRDRLPDKAVFTANDLCKATRKFLLNEYGLWWPPASERLRKRARASDGMLLQQSALYKPCEISLRLIAIAAALRCIGKQKDDPGWQSAAAACRSCAAAVQTPHPDLLSALQQDQVGTTIEVRMLSEAKRAAAREYGCACALQKPQPEASCDGDGNVGAWTLERCAAIEAQARLSLRCLL